MVSLDERVDKVIEAVCKIREIFKEITAYCTNDCMDCPLSGCCGFDQDIDIFDDYMTDRDRIQDYVYKALWEGGE